MKIRIILAAALLSLSLLAACGSAAPTTTTPLSTYGPSFVAATTRAVPDPVPNPWPDVPGYTETTYQITVKRGEQFAIGMFAPVETHYQEFHDQAYLNLDEDQMLLYTGFDTTKHGTNWFLYTATRKGTTELRFEYPIHYIKIFEVTIQ